MEGVSTTTVRWDRVCRILVRVRRDVVAPTYCLVSLLDTIAIETFVGWSYKGSKGADCVSSVSRLFICRP